MNLQLSPSPPVAGQTIYVSVQVNDSSGIANVTLYYRVNGGEWLAIKMVSSGNENYTVTFPNLPEGSSIDYYIQAYDSSTQYNMAQTPISSFTIESPTTPFIPPPAPDLLLGVGYGLTGLAVILALIALGLFLLILRKKTVM